jgi:predicted amino acid dehydrogenase
MRSFRIAELSFGSARWDFATRFRVDGDEFEVQRFGVEYSVEALKRMIERMRSEVDAIAISGFPTEIRFRDRIYIHRQALDVMSTPVSIPLCNGERLRELAEVNGAVQLVRSGALEPRDGVFFPVGVLNMEALSTLHERAGARIGFGDLYASLQMPIVAQPWPWLLEITKLGMGIAQLRDMGELAPRASNVSNKIRLERFTKELGAYRYVWGDPFLIHLFARDTSILRGREICTTTSDPRVLRELENLGARAIHQVLPEKFRAWEPKIGYSVADACLRLTRGKTAPLSLEDWQEILESETEIAQETRRYVVAARPSVQTRFAKSRINAFRRKTAKESPDFAFVLHSLSFRDLTRAPGLNLARRLPASFHPVLERATAKLPGIVYGHMRGVVSEKTGREVTGLLYGLFATPRVMREEPPEVTYGKIEKLCIHAAEQGAKIIGLGAYTKIVGDAGATINRMSPIPVTTGNSLSASATLWAVHDAITKMRLLKRNSNTGLVKGTATIIGATGSIGKVSAKLLALVFERVCIVAPRMDRLEDLAAELAVLNPKTEVRVSTDANHMAHDTDVLVTATSAFDQKIIDVKLLKPGCIVCDCSRPLDFTMEDVLSRPDVLFIESGEVVLPGAQNQLDCDIGLPKDVVYACLGETALLAMEELYEPFTLGRDLDWQKVKKIYTLGRAHGVRLAAIRGPSGIISDREIELCRALALKARGHS